MNAVRWDQLVYRDSPEIADHGDQVVSQATVVNLDRREKLVRPEVRDCRDRLDSLVNEGQLVQPGLAGYQARLDRKDRVASRVCRASVASLALPANRVNSEQSAAQDFQVCSSLICNNFVFMRRVKVHTSHVAVQMMKSQWN